MLLDLCEAVPDVVDVDEHLGVRVERDPLPVSSDPSVGKPRPQCGEGATQAASRPVWIVPRPEQGRKDIAVVRGAGDGEVGEQSHRLARVDLHRVAVDQDLGRSEQMHLECNGVLTNGVTISHPEPRS